jgi:hypothetical protein
MEMTKDVLARRVQRLSEPARLVISPSLHFAAILDVRGLSDGLARRPLKRLLANVIELLPGSMALSIISRLRWMRYSSIREEAREHNRVDRALGSPRTVMQGPFKGMRYIDNAFFGMVLSRVLGTYEIELWAVVEEICRIQPDVIIDLGAAEGYYAVGLARRNPQAKVIAFEMYRPVWSMIRRLGTINGVTEAQLTIRGAADAGLLDESVRAAKKPVVISDIEGFEDDIIDPAKAPALRRATLLIELHEDYRIGVTQRIRERFSGTHDIQVIDLRARTPEDLPAGIQIMGEDLQRATDERRPKAQWFFLKPKA